MGAVYQVFLSEMKQPAGDLRVEVCGCTDPEAGPGVSMLIGVDDAVIPLKCTLAEARGVAEGLMRAVAESERAFLPGAAVS